MTAPREPRSAAERAPQPDVLTREQVLEKALREVLAEGENLTAKYASRDAAAGMDAVIGYVKAHNKAEAALSSSPPAVREPGANLRETLIEAARRGFVHRYDDVSSEEIADSLLSGDPNAALAATPDAREVWLILDNIGGPEGVRIDGDDATDTALRLNLEHPGNKPHRVVRAWYTVPGK